MIRQSAVPATLAPPVAPQKTIPCPARTAHMACCGTRGPAVIETDG